MPPQTKEVAGRRWRGKSAEQRRAERRSLLIEAGIELFGTRGYASTPVKAVCEAAGLTERYFYEAFPDREGLLSAIYDGLVTEAAEVTLAAIEAADDDLVSGMRAGLDAFARHVTADPRRARIQEIEVVGVSPEMERRRRRAIHAFSDLIAQRITRFAGDRLPPGARADVIALGLVGSVNEQLIEYVIGEIEISLDELIENQVLAFEALARHLTVSAEPGHAQG